MILPVREVWDEIVELDKLRMSLKNLTDEELMMFPEEYRAMASRE
jgi:hypothetical protein